MEMEELQAASEPNGAIWRRHLRPSGYTIIMLFLLGLLLLTYFCILAVEQNSPELPGIFCMGPLWLLPLISLARQDRPAGRVYVLTIAALLIALIGLASAAMLAQNPQEDAVTALVFFAFMPVPFALILLIPGGIFSFRAAREIRTALALNRLRRMRELVIEKEAATYAELARGLDVAPAEVDNMLDALIAGEALPAALYADFQRVYTHQGLMARYRQIRQLIQKRGQLFLADLAVELGAPTRLLALWLYDMVHLQLFSGYINWDTGTLYGVNARQIREIGRCPNCTGQLGLDGERVRCPYCNTEILLERAG
jgi:hypothetical protein